ncbi:MAG: hypothetical protein R2932_47105 [Caldilineaceae bacterium]
MRRRLGQRSEVMDLTGYRLTTGVAEVSLAAKLSKAFDWSLQLPLPLWNGLRLLSVGFAIGIAGILLRGRPSV